MPYGSDGAWVANEDGGWSFQSNHDEEFGWATYHYGRWVNHDDYGWVWIPGTEWAPSWVDWRFGGGFVGWAPMGPAGYVVPEERWGFVEQGHFGDANVWSVHLAPERIHAAFSLALAVDAHGGGGGGHWSAGPDRGALKSAGVSFKSVKISLPTKGAVKEHAKASVAKAKSAGRPAKAAGAAPVKRGATASRSSKTPARSPSRRPRRRPATKTGQPTDQRAAAGGKPGAQGEGRREVGAQAGERGEAGPRPRTPRLPPPRSRSPPRRPPPRPSPRRSSRPRYGAEITATRPRLCPSLPRDHR